MKNTKRQKSLDEKKYIESEQQGKDMSGAMPWCASCPQKAELDTCVAPHESRVLSSLCARAYNKMAKGK
jgi:hypothetical protein